MKPVHNANDITMHGYSDKPPCSLCPQMVCIQYSKSHRADNHSSRHHWRWSISWNWGLLELSTSLESFHLEIHSRSHLPDLETCQSQLPTHITLTSVSTCNAHTLQTLSFETRIFLAAKSLWTNPFPERYCIPRAICWENLRKSLGKSASGRFPGLQYYCYDTSTKSMASSYCVYT